MNSCLLKKLKQKGKGFLLSVVEMVGSSGGKLGIMWWIGKKNRDVMQAEI